MAPGMPRRNRQSGDAPFLRRACHFHVGHRRAGANDGALNRSLAETAAEADHDSGHPTVAHDEIGAKPDHGDGNLGGQMCEQVSEIQLVFRYKQKVR